MKDLPLLSLDRRNVFLINVTCKTKMFVSNATGVCRIAFSRRSDCGGDPQRDASRKKGEAMGAHSTTKKAIFLESNKGRPRLLIRRLVET